MKILYVAKHNSGDNDDEGAITHSLRELGHDVVLIPEREGQRVFNYQNEEIDFILFHKWDDYNAIEQAPFRKVFWYFDLVSSTDEQFISGGRNRARTEWMRRVTPHVHLGFCTDGDWVANDKTGKLRWLTQGADQRYMGFGTPCKRVPPILFTGSVINSTKRMEHIEHLKKRWGNQFGIVGDGGPNRRIHQRELADTLASATIVIAPDGPVTHRYWSNRVYLSLGFGAFLLHPYCHSLCEHYNAHELIMYNSREHLDHLIEQYLKPLSGNRRQEFRYSGLMKTQQCHTYLHRCAALIDKLERSL